MTAVGGGLAALANMATTAAGAPSGSGAERLAEASERARSRYLDEMEREDRRRKERDTALLQRLRTGSALRTAFNRDRREQQAAERRANAEKAAATRAERADERAERADRRAERRLEMQERREAAAENRGRQRSSGSTRTTPTFTWVDPGTGDRYTVARSTWDKSSYTLFGMVVDATRPEPDSRGYPAADEWRRHCFDTYTTAARRDAYIMRHLPEVPDAMRYLKRLSGK